MTCEGLTARPGQELVDLGPAFSDGGRHHLPVLSDDGRLAGIVTQSDMVASLFLAGLEQPSTVVKSGFMSNFSAVVQRPSGVLPRLVARSVHGAGPR